MTDDDRQWLQQVQLALHVELPVPPRLVQGIRLVVTISISDAVARGVADRLRSIAEGDAIVPP